MKTASTPQRAIRGFTLLEILVALSILAVALGALLQSFSTGLRGLGAAEAHAMALMHARSQLAKVGTLIPLVPGEHTGVADDFTWTVSVQPFDPDDREAPAAGAIVPYRLGVTVSWPRGGRIELTTMRTGPAT